MKAFKAVLAHAVSIGDIVGKAKAQTLGIDSTADIIFNAINEGDNEFGDDIINKVNDIILKGIQMTPESSRPGDRFQENVKNTLMNCLSPEASDTIQPHEVALLVWLPKIIHDKENPRQIEGKAVSPGEHTITITLLEKKEVNGSFGPQEVFTFKGKDGNFYELWAKPNAHKPEMGKVYTVKTVINRNRNGDIVPKPFNGVLKNRINGKVKFS
jgi:hypothetical protein